MAWALIRLAREGALRFPMRFRTPFLRRALCLAIVGFAVTAGVPTVVVAHSLTGRYESPLPLWAYLTGGGLAVALSFAIVLVRVDVPTDVVRPAGGSARLRLVPRWLAASLRAIGLVAWLWIMAQGIVGSSNSDADVSSLFVWTYGWVVLPILCALIGPVWDLIDPFVTLHDGAAALLRRLRIRGWAIADYPARLDLWPAAIGLAVVVWLELVLQFARGGRPLALIVLAYTAFTLVMMAQFGRDEWRRRGETFTVWFDTIGRLAPLAWAPGRVGVLVARPFGAGLLAAGWTTARVALLAVATAAILYDGLSQTQIWFDSIGTPGVLSATIQLGLFVGAITAAGLAVARTVGSAALGAGLVPIAFGYLVAHYIMSVVLDSQRIVTVLSDPLQLGWNLLGTNSYEPDDSWLPGSLIWTVQLTAVVGGHVLGAWLGHRAAVIEAAGEPGPKRRRALRAADAIRVTRRRQVPLAILMVCLTGLTLWSLGQRLVGSPVGALR